MKNWGILDGETGAEGIGNARIDNRGGGLTEEMKVLESCISTRKSHFGDAKYYEKICCP